MFCGSCGMEWHAKQDGVKALARLVIEVVPSGQNFYLKSDMVPLIKILSLSCSPRGHNTEILVWDCNYYYDTPLVHHGQDSLCNPDYEVTRFVQVQFIFSVCNAIQCIYGDCVPELRRCEDLSLETTMSHGKNTRNNSPWTYTATLSSMSSGVCRQINAITRVKSAPNKSSSNVIPPPDSQSVGSSSPVQRRRRRSNLTHGGCGQRRVSSDGLVGNWKCWWSPGQWPLHYKQANQVPGCCSSFPVYLTQHADPPMPKIAFLHPVSSSHSNYWLA